MAFNGALKQKLIAERVTHLYHELQAFKQAHDKDTTVVFKPAPISTHAAMQMVMRTYSAYAKDDNFKAGITRAFVKVGYLKDSKTGQYNLWTGVGLGGEYRPNSSSSRSRRRTRWACWARSSPTRRSRSCAAATTRTSTRGSQRVRRWWECNL